MQDSARESKVPVIIGIDPGTHKCGIAVLCDDERILYLATLPANRVARALSSLKERYHIKHAAVGTGVGRKEMMRDVGGVLGGVRVVAVDETDTTVEGIRLCLKRTHPMLRWARWLLLVLGITPADAWAALVIAKRSMD